MHFHHRSNTASNTSPKGREREREQHKRGREVRGFQGEENDIIQPKRWRPRFELSFEPSVMGRTCWVAC